MKKIESLQDLATAAAYGLYILGGSVVVGLVRGAICVANVAFKALFADKLKQSHAEKPKGFIAKAEHIIDKTLNGVDKALDQGANKMAGLSWEKQGARSVIELVPVIGGLYQAYYDLQSKERTQFRDPGVFAWRDITDLLDSEVWPKHLFKAVS